MSKERVKTRSPLFEVIMCVTVAVIISLVLILLAAFLIKICNIPTTAIIIINQIIKAISVLSACLICLKQKVNGWLKGLLSGFFYIIIAFIIFSLLDGGFSFTLKILNDLAIGCVTGLISGIISANIRK